PTTDSTEQDFCAVDNPTVADIQVNEPGVIWYDMPEGGTAYNPTDALIDGNTYYGSLTSAEGCESSERLAVTVHINDGGDSTIISDAEGDVCLNTIVTYTTESGQSNYVWEVFGGD